MSTEMIISPSAVTKILAEISAAMSYVEFPALESLASLGATLCSTMAAQGELVLALFHVSVRVPVSVSPTLLQIFVVYILNCPME